MPSQSKQAAPAQVKQPAVKKEENIPNPLLAVSSVLEPYVSTAATALGMHPAPVESAPGVPKQGVPVVAGMTAIRRGTVVPGVAGRAPGSLETEMQVAVGGTTIRCRTEVPGVTGGTEALEATGGTEIRCRMEGWRPRAGRRC